MIFITNRGRGVCLWTKRKIINFFEAWRKFNFFYCQCYRFASVVPRPSCVNTFWVIQRWFSCTFDLFCTCFTLCYLTPCLFRYPVHVGLDRIYYTLFEYWYSYNQEGMVYQNYEFYDPSGKGFSRTGVSHVVKMHYLF